MIEINEIFEQWKQFLSLCYENNDKTTEIHRDDLERVIVYTKKLENIIKEAIEYIENNKREITFRLIGNEETGEMESLNGELLNVLEILKGSDKE